MSSNCASCGNGARLRCVGCLDAPEYQPGDATTTNYCSSTCQKKDWPQHKARCRALSRRSKLLRAARIAKAALLTHREVFWDIDLKEIELRDGFLCLRQRLKHPSSQFKFVRFPEHLTTNVEYKEAALLNNQCTSAMALLGPLVRKMLKGIASTIDIMDVYIGKMRLPTKLVPGPDNSTVPHTVLKVKLRSTGEAWIVDTAGSQYGFREVLVPYDRYMAEKSCLIASGPDTYDATVTKDLDYYATLPYMNKTKVERDHLQAERKARICFMGFVDQGVGEDVLDGSTAEWEGKLDALVAALTAHLLKFVR